MLVLTSKAGRSIRIGQNVRIVFLTIKGNQIKLGIEAPPEIPIHREEANLKILKGNVKVAEVTWEHFKKRK